MSKKGRFKKKLSLLVNDFKEKYCLDDYENRKFLKMIESSRSLNELRNNMSRRKNFFCPVVFEGVDNNAFAENSFSCGISGCSIRHKVCWDKALNKYFGGDKQCVS